MVRKVKAMAFIKFFILVIASFAPFSHPHIIRQTDTMGVSYMYWLRFTNNEFTWKNFLPALLSAGDKTGISKMEFPILNLLMSPFFSFGIEVGRVLVSLAILVLAYYLIYLNIKAWKNKTIFGFDFSSYLWLLPLVGITGRYTGKFMPDLIAFLFVLLASGLAWEAKKFPWKSFVIGSIGLLMKPPVVVIYLTFLSKSKRYWLRHIAWGLPTVMITVIYYKLGLSFISEYADTAPEYFKTSMSDPIRSVIDFFEQPKEIFKLIVTDIFSPFLLPFVLIASFTSKKRKHVYIWTLLVVQMILIAFLDGAHSFVHDYYHIGLMIFVVILGAQFFENYSSKSWITNFVLLLILLGNLEKDWYRIRPLTDSDNMYQQCSQLNKNQSFSKSLRVRTQYSVIPKIGLCLGKIQNSKNSKWGVYYKNKLQNGTIDDHEVIDETKDLKLVRFH